MLAISYWARKQAVPVRANWCTGAGAARKTPRNRRPGTADTALKTLAAGFPADGCRRFIVP